MLREKKNKHDSATQSSLLPCLFSPVVRAWLPNIHDLKHPFPPAGRAELHIKMLEGKPGEFSAADIGWRDSIIDERLQKVIDLAFMNNRDLRVAVLNIERTQALYRIQRAELLPTVNAGGTFSKERVPGILSGSGKPLTTELYNVNLGISSWELDLFGRIRSLRDAALQEYLATEQACLATQISLVAEVANTYLTLAADRELLKLGAGDPESPGGNI